MKKRVLIAAAMVLAAACACASGSGEDGPIDPSGITVIVVRSGPFDVSVSGGEDGELSIDSNPRAGFFPHDAPPGRIVQRREGSRLSVWIENAGPFESAPGGSVQIHPLLDTDLVVQTSSGSVSVDGVGKGKCAIRTVSGRIRVSRGRGSLSVDSVSGSIAIDSAEGAVKAHSVSGSISGRGLALTGDSSFSSVAGNVEVALSAPLETLSFDLRSVSGRITVGSIRTERGLRMGFGETCVRGNTISGNLSFR